MKDTFYFLNGRSTLNVILKSLNLKENHEVLYPEFSCDVLFQYKNKKYKYMFYATNKNFTVNKNYLKKKISINTKVIIIINFFGLKQNTKSIYNYCKERNIYLIIDDCHSFYNPKLKLNNHCDFKFFSPSKLFPDVDFGGILKIYNKNFKLKKIKHCNSQYSKNILKNFIKSSIFFKKIKDLKSIRPEYENPTYFKSKYIVKDCLLNINDQNKIKNINYIGQKKIVHKNFKFWQKVSRGLKLQPIITYNSIKHGIPLYYVAKCKTKSQSNKIFDLGWKNNVEITSWPTLHPKMIKNKKVIDYWKRLVFFPIINKINSKTKKLPWKI